MEAARKKFTPEFINRLDAMVVFRALGEAELRQVIEIELRRVQQRVLRATPFVFHLTEAAVEQLLVEGTDPRYGARHLRRAIDRLLVQPISNLLASDQLRGDDCLLIDSEPESREMTFVREAGGPVAGCHGSIGSTALVSTFANHRAFPTDGALRHHGPFQGGDGFIGAPDARTGRGPALNRVPYQG